MEQAWHDLLFAHYAYPPEAIRSAVPPQLPIDTFDGKAYIGVVPFSLRGLRARWLPRIPALSDFPELNVRTYVTIDGKPGVYFFSLDAGNRLAVIAARTAFHLNYYHALMSASKTQGSVTYLSRRTDKRGAPADFVARYQPTGKAVRATPDSLEYFLTERYCLYAVTPSGRVNRMEIHHPPWLLQPASAQLDPTAMLRAAGLPPAEGEPLLHFSAVQEMVGWLPERVR